MISFMNTTKLLDLGMSKHDRVVHILIGYFLRACLDHDDLLLGSRNGKLEISLSHAARQVGLIMKSSSSIMPTNTPPIGPFHGISEMERAMDAPIIAVISGEQS